MALVAVKNYLIRRGVEKLLKEYVKRIVNLSIDPASKSIQFSVELNGEDAPIDIDVKRYELDDSSGKLFLVIHDISISKEWMNVLAGQVVKGRSFEIGAGSEKILKVMRMMKLI